MPASTENSDRDSRALLDLAKSTKNDLYALLGLPASAADQEQTLSPPASKIQSDPQQTASISAGEIAKAHRKAAARNHPDNPRNRERKDAAIEIFHLVKEAWAVLGDVVARQAYDERRAAEWARQERESLLEGRRKAAFEELRRREADAAAGVKRKWGDAAGSPRPAAAEDDLTRLAAAGARKRQEMEERRRRLREEQAQGVREGQHSHGHAPDQQSESNGTSQTNGLHAAHSNGNSDTPHIPSNSATTTELDRTVKVRWPRLPDTSSPFSITPDTLKTLFSPFGRIENTFLLKDKKSRPSLGPESAASSPDKSSKKLKRQLMGTACVVFSSIVGAHAAVLDAPSMIQQARSEICASPSHSGSLDAGNIQDITQLWALIDAVDRASSQREPQPADATTISNAPEKESGLDTSTPHSHSTATTPRPSTPITNSNETNESNAGNIHSAASAPPQFPFLKKPLSGSSTLTTNTTPSKPPSFASFASPSAAKAKGVGLAEMTMMRLKEAEMRRREQGRAAEEEKIRRAEAGNGMDHSQ